SRAERAIFLRAFAAATTLRCDVAVGWLDDLGRTGASPTTSSGMLAPSLDGFCSTRLGRTPRMKAGDVTRMPRAFAREVHYWLAASALRRGDATGALGDAEEGLRLLDSIRNDELRWRLATVAASAARQLGRADLSEQMTATAKASLERLRNDWKGDYAAYERRPDLQTLKSPAPQNPSKRKKEQS